MAAYSAELVNGIWKVTKFDDRKRRNDHVLRSLGSFIHCQAISANDVPHFQGNTDIADECDIQPEAPPKMHTETDDLLWEIAQHWPCDVILSSMLGELITGRVGSEITRHHANALGRAGMTPYGAQIKFNGEVVRVTILRNVTKWKDAMPLDIRRELYRIPLLQTAHLALK